MKKVKIIALSLLMFLTSCSKSNNQEIVSEDFSHKSIKYVDNLSSNSNSDKKQNFSVVKEGQEQVIDNKKKDKRESKEIDILATGDILFHEWINDSYKTENGYDYRDIYEPFENMIKNSDLAIANFEQTVDPEKPVSSYPTFNSPVDTIYYLRDLGFDALGNSNNHVLDNGVEGLISTHKLIEENSMKVFGTHLDKERKPTIVDVNGIKVALLAYSQFFNGLYEWYITDDNNYLVDDLDMDKVKKDIESVKDKSDLIIVYPHWGDEYVTEENSYQTDLAHKMIDMGADLVLGAHPHVLQGSEEFEKDGKKKFIIYSMGNSMNGQWSGYSDNWATECGVFLNFKVKKTDSDTQIENIDIIPSYIHHYYDDNNIESVKVYPIRDIVDGKYNDRLDQETISKVTQYQDWCNEILNIK
ncbi:MAG: CapA family protein [Tissierellia bacterium]|nr:CapA family protein [Tissierellia bacterium]